MYLAFQSTLISLLNQLLAGPTPPLIPSRNPATQPASLPTGRPLSTPQSSNNSEDHSIFKEATPLNNIEKKELKRLTGHEYTAVLYGKPRDGTVILVRIDGIDNLHDLSIDQSYGAYDSNKMNQLCFQKENNNLPQLNFQSILWRGLLPDRSALEAPLFFEASHVISKLFCKELQHKQNVVEVVYPMALTKKKLMITKALHEFWRTLTPELKKNIRGID